MRGLLTVLISLGCLLPAGCGSGEASVYPVKGLLRNGGAPFGNVHLVLSPTEGNIPFASADVQSDGTFELKSSDGRMGAAVGKYKVVLSPLVGSTDPMKAMLEMRDKSKGGKKDQSLMDPKQSKSKDDFPKEYKDVKTSPKTVEITGEQLNFEISI